MEIADKAGRTLWTFRAVSGELLSDLLLAARYNAAGVDELFDDLLGIFTDAVREAKSAFDRASKGTREFVEAGARLLKVIDATLRDLDQQASAPSYLSPEWREVHTLRLEEDRERLISLKARVEHELDRFSTPHLATL